VMTKLLLLSPVPTARERGKSPFPELMLLYTITLVSIIS
jgi:hypothetical protein